MSRIIAVAAPRIMYHYTDRDGYNSIRAGVEWRFKVAQPPKCDADHPPAAYFTMLGPRDRNLERLRLPVEKRLYVFAFSDLGDLTRLRGGRGQYILYSKVDYVVEKDRQFDSGLTADVESRQKQWGE